MAMAAIRIRAMVAVVAGTTRETTTASTSTATNAVTMMAATTITARNATGPRILRLCRTNATTTTSLRTTTSLSTTSLSRNAMVRARTLAKKKSKRNHHHQPSAALALPASLRLGPDAGAGRRYLCILDLNGVLMARLSHSDHSLAAAAARAANAPFPTAAGTVSRRRLYLRPHAASTFAHWMAAASRVFDFAVWTSAVPENAARITETVFGPEKAERLLKFVWGRDRCDAVDDDASVSWATVKDLKNVYSEFPQYRPDRTLILDDSMAKCSRNPRNALVVPTWDLVHRRPGCVSDHSDEAFDPNQCRVLEHLASYLSAMAHAAPTDVRSWLAERPFAVPFNVLAREGGIIAGGIPRSDGLGTTTTTTNGDVNVDANALLGMPEDHNNYWVVNEEPGFQLPAWAKGADVRGLPDRRSDGDAKHEQQKLKKWTGMVTFDGDDEEATVPIESPSSPVSVTSS
ncbi:hypothetical protein BC828DRAFT_393438 [Blastocladiella britannica]|nr:hypothetical protein BC828DRAFT_393438 [Blastocladiella britannica]